MGPQKSEVLFTSSKVPETGSKSSAPDSNKSAIECAGGLDLEELEKRIGVGSRMDKEAVGYRREKGLARL